MNPLHDKIFWNHSPPLLLIRVVKSSLTKTNLLLSFANQIVILINMQSFDRSLCYQILIFKFPFLAIIILPRVQIPF